ncbi:glycosyltransferase [Nonomuraea phyllanthi]|uniref:glycosyltransferase family 4 protein n=1 Tax=Nonomuraea phyllanthi TaxID=2219224 RepID=UPI0012938D74|nr:glycosyltransferase family 4 protein [Nonomuraea phyllanthi]QFY13728.1 glycosyltransferase [Nonomuraea phyllanthi]
MLIEPSVTGKVVVALQDGFYGASSGSGFSNRDFLIALTRLLPPDRLVVVSVRGYSDPIDPFWTAQLLKSLRRAKAQTVLVNHCGEDSAHGRDLLTEMVASVVSGEDRCLVVGLDRSLLGLAADDNRDLLLVPRSTAALTCADLSEIIWERDCLHTAVKSGGHVVAISDFMRRHLRDDYGLPGDALVVMPNGLLLDDDAPSEQANALPRPAEEGFLLSHGRAVPDKGFEDLLAALEILRSRRVPVPHLVLAATAPGPTTAYQRHLARVIEDSHVDATLVTEFNPRIRAWMSSPVLRGIVVPSRREPFGRIPLEAFAAGAGPVIATRAGGLPETVVDGCTGFTAEPHDPASLADAIHRGLTVTPSERVHLVKAGGALLHERHDYLANIQAALAAVAPWALSWSGVR